VCGHVVRRQPRDRAEAGLEMLDRVLKHVGLRGGRYRKGVRGRGSGALARPRWTFRNLSRYSPTPTR
jgi:hypothetical protein